MKRILLVLAIMAIFLATLAGLAFAQEGPSGAGCDGLFNAQTILKVNNPNDKDQNGVEQVKSVQGAHSC